MVTTSNRAIIDTDLQEVTNRHDAATAVVDVLNRALGTIPLLSAEINRLRRRLATTLGDFNTVGEVPWYSQPIPIVGAESALAFYICFEFAVGRGDMEASSWLQMGQQDCRDLVNTSDVPLPVSTETSIGFA